MAPPNAKGKGRETVFRLWSPARYRHILAVRLAAVRVGRLGGQGSALQRSLVVKVVTIWSDLAKWMAIDQVSGPAPRRIKGSPKQGCYGQDDGHALLLFRASGRRTLDDQIPSPVITNWPTEVLASARRTPVAVARPCQMGPPAPLPSFPLRFPRRQPRNAPSLRFPHACTVPGQLQQAAVTGESHCNMYNTRSIFKTFG
jgi:hypothetical protein